MRGQEDDRNLGPALDDRLQQIEAARARHAEIGDDDVHRALAQDRERAVRVGDPAAGDPGLHQQRLDDLPDVGVIVDDQHVSVLFAHDRTDSSGMNIRTVVPAPFLADERDLAAVRLRDPPNEGEPQPGARLLGGEEVVERALAHPGAHADAAVLDGDHDPSRLARAAQRGPHRHARVAGVRLEGVLQEVLDRAGHQIAIGVAVGEIPSQVGLDDDVRPAVHAAQRHQVLDQVVDLNRRQRRLHVAQALVPVDRAFEPIDLRHQQLEELRPIVDRSALGALLAQELAGPLERRQRVLEVVRHLSGHLAQRGQPDRLVSPRDDRADQQPRRREQRHRDGQASPGPATPCWFPPGGTP